MQLDYVLCKIKPDCCNLHFVALSVSGSSQFPLWHFDAVSGRGDHSISLDRLPPVAKDQTHAKSPRSYGAKRSVKGVAARQKKRLNLFQQV
jgi:hypothetical protein